MKCLIVNTYDTAGGAARAAYRLHKGLQGIGVQSGMLVQTKFSDDPTVIGPQGKVSKGLSKLRPHLEALPLQFYPHRHVTPWGPAWLPGDVGSKIKSLNPDIIHLHWICDGFVPVSSLARFDRPIVWTLHDSWAFTGGCHIPFECTRYKAACGSCPHLGSSKETDLSRGLWNRKARHWKGLNLTVVTPSRWLADCVKDSSLFSDVRVEVIPNGLDLNRYKPVNQQTAREMLNLPGDKKLILFGAMDSLSDRNKGFQFLQTALQHLAEQGWGGKAELIVFGASKPLTPPDLQLKTHYPGILHDDISLSLLYAAADVFVAPSIQENLSNTVMEALACGTPCVAFDIGGMPDMIIHEYNGYLAKPFEPIDLTSYIIRILSDDNHREKLSCQARTKVERDFEIGKIAGQYLNLYDDILRK